MAGDWLKIRKDRLDVTDYLIHWTRGTIDANGNVVPAFEVLKTIIQCGFLKPSFAPKSRVTVGGQENTIKGPYPAVCFTEQPLSYFVVSCNSLPSRYQSYAVAIRKDRLFVYGGRPVAYGDERFLNQLADEWKYLWVRYDPIPNYHLGGYPVDWTHEREWRVRAVEYSYGSLGTSPKDGIPLLLPPQMRVPQPYWYLPWILVRKEAEAKALRQFIASLPPYSGTNKILSIYFENLAKMPVVPLEEVEAHQKAGDTRWARLDTLPLEELDNTAASAFKRLGWRDLK